MIGHQRRPPRAERELAREWAAQVQHDPGGQVLEPAGLIRFGESVTEREAARFLARWNELVGKRAAAAGSTLTAAKMSRRRRAARRALGLRMRGVR